MQAITQAVEDLERYKEDLDIVYLKNEKLFCVQREVMEDILNVLTEAQLQLTHEGFFDYDEYERNYLNKRHSGDDEEEEEDEEEHVCGKCKIKIKYTVDAKEEDTPAERKAAIQDIFDRIDKNIFKAIENLRDV